MSSRFRTGSVAQDNRSKVWNFFWWEDGKRKCKALGRFPTKASAWKAAKPLRDGLEKPQQPKTSGVPIVSTLVVQYRDEKMPQRFSTRYSYEQWLANHIVPRWGECPVTELQARPVELWIHSLALSPKSKSDIRGLIRILWDFSMWRGDIPTQRNPMELVTIKGATKRTHKPRALTVEEFQRFVSQLSEPFRTVALVCICLGLRISECLALKWADVDWLNGRLRVERSIVRQHLDDVKTAESRKRLSINSDLLDVLKAWKQVTPFSAQDDWIFASPARLGRLPWSYPRTWQVFKKAAERTGIGRLGTHAMRHSYRSWLDAVGTPIAVQQKLMRHADIRTTLNVYGDVVTDEMAVAGEKVTRLALNGM